MSTVVLATWLLVYLIGLAAGLAGFLKREPWWMLAGGLVAFILGFYGFLACPFTTSSEAELLATYPVIFLPIILGLGSSILGAYEYLVDRRLRKRQPWTVWEE